MARLLRRLLPAWGRDRIFDPAWQDRVADALDAGDPSALPGAASALSLWLGALRIVAIERARRVRGLSSLAIGRLTLPRRRAGAASTSNSPNERGHLMESLLLDLRSAWRNTRSRPGFSLVVVAILTLGIGASTIVFTLLDSVVLRPLPFRDAGQLVYVTEARLDDTGPVEVSVTPADFRDWREAATSFAGMAAFNNLGFNITGGDFAERVEGFMVSSNFFEILGVEPALGRTFLGDPAAGERFEVVISHGLWMQRYGGDPGVIGSAIQLSEQRHTVVGVAPAGFRFQSESDIWVAADRDVPPPPIAIEGDYHDNRDLGYFKVLARLHEGVTIEQASEEMAAIHAGIAETYPDAQGNRTATVHSLHEILVGEMRQPLTALLIAVGVVLAITCANVAGLLLARATTRRREIAVRAALGASRGRIIRQMLAESLLLAAIGGALAIGLAYAVIEVLPGVVPFEVPRIDELTVDLRVLGFGVLLSLVNGMLFGSVPAWQLARADAGTELQSGRGDVSSGFANARGFLVVVEVALALVLVVGAGLMSRGLVTLLSTDPGFDPGGVVTARLVLPENRYDDDDKVRAFYRESLERFEAIPGVQSAALSLSLPFSGSAARVSTYRADRPVEPGNSELRALLQMASPGYFRTMGIPLVRGRDITAADIDGTPLVAVVSEEYVRRYLGDAADPLTVPLSFGDEDTLEIVGVVGDVRHDGYGAEIEPSVYLSAQQLPWRFAAFVLKTDGDPAALAEPLRDAVREVDPQQPVVDARPLSYFMDRTVAGMRFGTWLLIGFAASAMLLAGLGLFGLLNYTVSQRSGEIGVRMALGASRGQVLTMILRQGMALVGVGLAAGLVLGLAGSRLVDLEIDGVSTLDPLVIAAAAIVLAAVGALAVLLPARRATRIDPIAALRAD